MTRLPTCEKMLVGGMAALACADDFMPIYNLQSLEELVAPLSRIPARRGERLPAIGGVS
jgi:hypothetical protein